MSAPPDPSSLEGEPHSREGKKEKKWEHKYSASAEGPGGQKLGIKVEFLQSEKLKCDYT